jgi:hypothetical protein
MWQTFLGVIGMPRRALTRLERRPEVALDGISALRRRLILAPHGG